MIDYLKNSKLVTGVVTVVGIVGVCFLAYFGAPPDKVAEYAAAFIAMAGVAKGLLDSAKSEEEKK